MLTKIVQLIKRLDKRNGRRYNRAMTEKLDARGIPTNECPTCANRLFTVQVSFDDDYNVGQYFLDAECAMCGTLVTAPTPLDHAEYSPTDVRWL